MKDINEIHKWTTNIYRKDVNYFKHQNTIKCFWDVKDKRILCWHRPILCHAIYWIIRMHYYTYYAYHALQTITMTYSWPDPGSSDYWSGNPWFFSIYGIVLQSMTTHFDNFRSFLIMHLFIFSSVVNEYYISFGT